jgi:uncharacterized repeat protein (TIGR01451 family)
LEDRLLLAADLTLTMSVSPVGNVVPDEQLVYTIKASNGASGTTAATGVVVTDGLSGFTSYSTASVTGPGATISHSGNTVTADLGTLAVNQTDTITIVVFVSPYASGSIENIASMTNTSNDTNPPNAIVVSNAGFAASQQACSLQGQPGDGTVPTGVANLYEELLGRKPDAAGFGAWVAFGQANQNAYGDAFVVSGFMNSPEYKAHYVSCVYEVFLGRAPEASGLAFWTAQMGNPGTAGQHTGAGDEGYVLSSILASDEFYRVSGGTPQGWIGALYQDLLGRSADGGGMSFWEQELSARGPGNRDVLVRDLLSTPEAVHDLLNSYYPAVGGTSAAGLPPPGTPAGLNSSKLAELIGGGWENLYFEGPYDDSPQANDQFFSELLGGASWDDVQYQMLTSQQYFLNPNRPTIRGAAG